MRGLVCAVLSNLVYSSVTRMTELTKIPKMLYICKYIVLVFSSVSATAFPCNYRRYHEQNSINSIKLNAVCGVLCLVLLLVTVKSDFNYNCSNRRGDGIICLVSACRLFCVRFRSRYRVAFALSPWLLCPELAEIEKSLWHYKWLLTMRWRLVGSNQLPTDFFFFFSSFSSFLLYYCLL